MRALITGITGMVGSHLADYLLANTDWEIIGLSRWRSSLRNLEHLAKELTEARRLRLVHGDLRDAGSIRSAVEAVRPDYVFHLAAQSYPQYSFAAPLDTLETNILGTATVLETVKAAAPQAIVHVCSSSEVFGRVGREWLPIKEATPFHPASPYAISKAGTDLLGTYYAEAFGLRVLTTRMFTHTGPRRGEVFHESSFAKQIAMIEAGLLPRLLMVGNLDSLRTYADVRDAVKAYYLLVTVNPQFGECYNIGGSHTCTVGDTLKTLLRLGNAEDVVIEVDKDRLRPVDADLQVPDSRKFAGHTGWKPEIPFEQTLQDLLDYWRQMVKRGEAVGR